jgi:hypothetical protein
VREQASEVDRGVGSKCKIVWGNLQAMTEKGEIFKKLSNKNGSFGIKNIQKHLS